MRDFKRMRLLCGLRQIDVWAGTGIPVGRLSQAEQGRTQLSEPEQALLASFLRERWEAIRVAELNMGPEVNRVSIELPEVATA